MSRVKRGCIAKRRRNDILKRMKGSKGSISSLSRSAQQQIIKTSYNSYIDRRLKKRNFRSLWITRINAASKLITKEYQFKRNQFLYGLDRCSYNRIIEKLSLVEIVLNRKILAQLAVLDFETFEGIVTYAIMNGPL